MRTPRTKIYNPNAPLQIISHASRTTGLSQYYLRKGCKDGTVPHIVSGRIYMVNVPMLLEKLGKESMK